MVKVLQSLLFWNFRRKAEEYSNDRKELSFKCMKNKHKAEENQVTAEKYKCDLLAITKPGIKICKKREINLYRYTNKKCSTAIINLNPNLAVI